MTTSWLHRSILSFVLAARALAQTTAGLNGTVTDSSGAVVPDVRVTLTSAETGARREALTNEAGLYQFPLLQPGVYSLSVQKQGFKQVTEEGFQLQLNQVARIDFTLSPGAVSDTIEVKAVAPLLEASTSSVGQVIETKAVSDLPLNGRNFAQLAILGPGVTGVGYSASGTIGSGTRPDDMRPGTELFSNGNREQSNNFMLDGVDNNFRRNGLITLRPSVEAVREFKIQTNLFEAEQGRNPGATINVITKSGTNHIPRQRLRVFAQCERSMRRTSSRNPARPSLPSSRTNSAAASAAPSDTTSSSSLPITKGYRKRQGTFASVNTVPIAALRNGDFSVRQADLQSRSPSGPRPGTPSGYTRDPFPGNIIPKSLFDSVTSRLIQAYPLPDTRALVNNQITNPVQRQNWDQGDIRADYNVAREQHAVRPLLATEYSHLAAVHLWAAHDSRPRDARRPGQLRHLRGHQ